MYKRRAVILMVAALAFAAAAHAQEADNELGWVSEAGGGTITLYKTVGPCKMPAKHAVHIAKDGEKTDGCWTPGTMGLNVMFFDGDTARITFDALKPPNRT